MEPSESADEEAHDRAKEVFELLQQIWKNKSSARVLVAVVLEAKTQRQLQRELKMHRSTVSSAIVLLQQHQLIRTIPARRDSFHAVNARGLQLAALVEDLMRQNNLPTSKDNNRGASE